MPGKPATIGDNSAAPEVLKSLTERICRLLDEKEALAADISEIYKEAKSQGFDERALRVVIRDMRRDAAERAEQEALIEAYKQALGMLDGTPLGQAALRAVL